MNVDRVRAVWVERGFDVPSCPYTEDELAALAASGRRVAFLPRELATQRGRTGLGEIFPLMRCYSLLADNIVVNDEDAWGWFDYETDIDAPLLDRDEPTSVEELRADGRVLLSLNQYVVASQDSHDLTGRYLDERRSWTRVAARIDGKMVCARFDGPEMAEGLGNEEPIDGTLLVAYDVQAGDRGPVLGARSTSLGPHRQIAAAQPSSPRLPELVGVPADLDTEWQRQVQRHLDAGYHHAIGVTADEYRASIPRLGPQPDSYRGRFDVPVLVEARMPWTQAAPLAGINLSAHTRRFGYEPVAGAPERPEQPYWMWCNGWGQRFTDPVAPADARAALRDDEVAANVGELVAMHLACPGLIERGRWLEAIGSLMPSAQIDGLSHPVPAVRVAGLMWWRARPEIGANLHPTEYTMFRPLVRGAAITT
jgi:hypothetical protein